MKKSIGQKIFDIVNCIVMVMVILVCLLPFIQLLAISFSSNQAALSGKVLFLPVDFTVRNYSFLSAKPEFLRALLVSVERVVLGVAFNMVFTILVAYPLSKPQGRFRARNVYLWFFAFTMFFSGGMIPTYMVVRGVGLIDNILALILPGTINFFNIMLLMRFFREIPMELEEAAVIDGANHFQVLVHTYLPISLPALATILLFVIVGHWNSWFDAILYMNDLSKYPLQTYLSNIVRSATLSSDLTLMSPEQLALLDNIGEKSLRSAQIFLGALPVLCVYPFLQKYFIKGIAVGSVKG